MNNRAIRRALLLAGLAAPLVAWSQKTDSGKPLKIVVPFSSGSASDALARNMGQMYATQTGRTVIVENKPGGSGIIAIQTVMSSPPDGSTLLLGGTSTHSANPHLIEKLPYNPATDLKPVTPLGKGWLIILANKDLPVRNLREFIEYAKARPGKVFLGSGSPGLRVPAEMLKQMTGIVSDNVQYRGSPQALTDLLGNQVQWSVVDVGTAMPFIKAGQVKALAVTNAARYPRLPDVPTAAEAGVPGYDISNWLGLFAPAQTPADVISALNSGFVKAASRPESEDRVFTPAAMARFTASPSEMTAFWMEDSEKWGKIIRAAGITPE